jgi:G3E family GTPase
MKLPIPVNIITGGLGSGKTTLISSLLASKPSSALAGERWAILVNEFGSLGIDGTLIDAAASNISEGDQNHFDSGISWQRSCLMHDALPLMMTGSVFVKELAGGCECHAPMFPYMHAPPSNHQGSLNTGLCCTLSGPMGAAIAQLIRTAKPDRLLIEPSGLGHPAGEALHLHTHIQG